MIFTCPGCYQNPIRNIKYNCLRYSSWVRHVAGPDHAQWSADHYQTWNSRECDTSIVVVVLPGIGPKVGPKKLTHQDVVDAFSECGIIQDFYMDRSGNFAVIQFDDVIPLPKIFGVKNAYQSEGFLSHEIAGRNVLIYPRSAPVFNKEATWRFLKQNHEITKLKNALAPAPLPALPEAEPCSSEFVIVPLKPTTKASDNLANTSTSRTSVNPSLSSSVVAGRVFVNSNLKPEEAGLVSGLEFGTIKFLPSAQPNMSSSFSDGDNDNMPARPVTSESVSSDDVVKNSRRRRADRRRSNSTSTSGNGDEPDVLPPYTKTKEVKNAGSQNTPVKSELKSKVPEKNLQVQVVTSQPSVVIPSQASGMPSQPSVVKPGQASVMPSQPSVVKPKPGQASVIPGQPSVVKPGQPSVVKPGQPSVVKPGQPPFMATQNSAIPSQATVKASPAFVKPSQPVASPKKSSKTQAVNGDLGKIFPSSDESQKNKTPTSILQQPLPGFPRPLLPGPVFRPLMMMPVNGGVNVNPFFPLNNPYLPPPQVQMVPLNLAHTSPSPAPMGLLSPGGFGVVGQPNAGLVFPQYSSDKDFYDLFAHFSNSGPGLRTQKEKLKKMTDEFLSLPIDTQMDCFILATTVTEKERVTREMITRELEHHLKIEYPNARLYVFGSMITFLCATDSDIDVVVDLFGTLHAVSGTEKPVIKGVQKYLDSLGTRKRPVYYVQPILQARIPILKLTHRESRINVDLSFENFMSVRNSNLILLYMRLDPRVRPMMVFIRYWAKFHELSGSFFIKNYAFILLVINYLTSPGVKLIPTVQQLQDLHDPKAEKDTHCIIDGYWNAGFCHDLNKIRAKTNKNEVPKPPTWRELLDLCYGFFKMYSELDFENSVICPLIGDTLPRDQFQPGHEEELPASMERYKVYTASHDLDSRFRISAPLKLQDPFHLQFNVGSITPAHTLFTFRVLCHNMIETFHDFQTRRKRLPTIIDLLTKLPGYVTERQSFALQQAGKQRLWLSHELSLVIAEDEADDAEFDASVLSRIVEPSSPAADVSDLWLVKKLVEIGKTTSGHKNGTFEFDIGRNFYEMFVQNLKKLNGLPEPEEIPIQVKLLWSHFVIEYLNQIWSTGFHLGITKRSRWSIPISGPADVTRTPRRWVTNSGATAGDLPNPDSNVSETDRQLILQSLEDLVKNQKTGEVYYFRICTTECKSFFTGRKVVHRKLLKSLQDREANAKPSPEGKPKKKLAPHVNPIEFEGQVTTAVLQKDSQAIKSPSLAFKLEAYGKLDLKLDEDDFSSELQLVFKRLEKGSSTEAFDALTKTIKETLPTYVIHRLLNFFKVFGSEKIRTTNYPSIDFDLDDGSEEDEDENENDVSGLENGIDTEFVIDTFENILGP